MLAPAISRQRGYKGYSLTFSNVVKILGIAALLVGSAWYLRQITKREGIVENIIRVLPPHIGQVLAQYLVYVHTFTRSMDKRESHMRMKGLGGVLLLRTVGIKYCREHGVDI
jgi:hypothetical protein